MTRTILASLAVAVGVTILTGTGCQSSGVGNPCVPEAEYSQSFLGFSVGEVNVESRSFQCETRLCLANHFQGRVTCPYGQNKEGTGAFDLSGPPTSSTAPGQPCSTPIGQTVNGCQSSSCATSAPTSDVTVNPNCSDRTAANAVYCSCRCADIDGNTNDGAVYCSCPNGYACTQLVTSIGAGGEAELTGAYCMKSNTAYEKATSCTTNCTEINGGCGAAQGSPN